MFKSGDKVRMKRTGKEGVVVSLHDDGILVDAGGWKIKCKEKDIEAAIDSKWQKKKDAMTPKYSAPKLEEGEHASENIDLHGLKVHEALPIVQKLIDRAIVADYERVSILHGVGTGALLQAIHKYLKSQSVVSHFHLDDNNPGVTWVYF